MKAVSIILEAVLILGIMTTVALTAMPFAQRTMETSVQSTEIANTKADFLKCSDKILDTARTGSGNKCIISATVGKLSVKTDGLYYTITGDSMICSPQDWALIDINKQVWQKCAASGDKKIYELKWFYPKSDVVVLEGTVNVMSVSSAPLGINYNLIQKGILFVEFDSPKDLTGKTIELTRYSASENTTVLSVNVI